MPERRRTPTFAGFCAVTYVFVRWFVPETKVERLWGDPDAIRRAIADQS